MQLYRPLFQNVFCNSKSFQISSECNIYHSCFHFFLCSSKSFEIPPECTMFRPYFSFCSFKNRQNAQFTVLVFKCFSAVRNRRLSRNPRSVPDRYKLDVHDRPWQVHAWCSRSSLTGTSLMFTIVPDRYKLDVHDRPWQVQAWCSRSLCEQLKSSCNTIQLIPSLWFFISLIQGRTYS